MKPPGSLLLSAIVRLFVTVTSTISPPPKAIPAHCQAEADHQVDINHHRKAQPRTLLPTQIPRPRCNAGRAAENDAARRALETRVPNGLFKDSFAATLAGPRAMARVAVQASSGSTDRVVIRTHYFDRWMCAVTRPQVVILGAALDMRAFRLTGLAGAVVFEVDTASVLAFKLGKLNRDRNPPRQISRTVRRVSAKISDDWRDKMYMAGFDPSKPTTWVVESGMPIMSGRSVEDLLDRVRCMSAPGSRLGFSAETAVGGNGKTRSAMPHPQELLSKFGFVVERVDALGGPRARFDRCARVDWQRAEEWTKQRSTVFVTSRVDCCRQGPKMTSSGMNNEGCPCQEYARGDAGAICMRPSRRNSVVQLWG